MKKIFTTISTFCVVALAWAGSADLTFNHLFTIDAATDPAPSYFAAADMRSCAVFENNLFIANKSGLVHVLDATTGEYIRDLDNTGIWGGDITLSDIKCLEDGTVVASNCRLTVTDAATLKVYYWDDLEAAPKELINYGVDKLTPPNGNAKISVRAFDYIGTIELGNYYAITSDCAIDNVYVIKIPVTNGTPGDPVFYSVGGYPSTTSARIRVDADESGFWFTNKGESYYYTFDSTSICKYYNQTGNKKYTNAFEQFSIGNTPYYATVDYLDGSIGTITNPLVSIYTYESWGRWGSSGKTLVSSQPESGLVSSARNINFFDGLAIRTLANNEKAIYMVSPLSGITAFTVTDPTVSPTAIEENNLQSAKVYAANGRIMVETTAGEAIEVYTVTGQLIVRTVAEDGVTALEAGKGVAIVKVGNQAHKVIL